MSKLVGMLHDKKIYSNHPDLPRILCSADFVPASFLSPVGTLETRCDYCGRANAQGRACASCGAPL